MIRRKTIKIPILPKTSGAVNSAVEEIKFSMIKATTNKMLKTTKAIGFE
jgi:hypothetical protein